MDTISLIDYMTEKHRPDPGIEIWASRLTYERSTTKLSRSTQSSYLNLGFFLITLVSYRVCRVSPYSRIACAGMRAWYMYEGCYIVRQYNLLYYSGDSPSPSHPPPPPPIPSPDSFVSDIHMYMYKYLYYTGKVHIGKFSRLRNAIHQICHSNDMNAIFDNVLTMCCILSVSQGNYLKLYCL